MAILFTRYQYQQVCRIKQSVRQCTLSVLAILYWRAELCLALLGGCRFSKSVLKFYWLHTICTNPVFPTLSSTSTVQSQFPVPGYPGNTNEVTIQCTRYRVPGTGTRGTIRNWCQSNSNELSRQVHVAGPV
eukprot:3236329-Rhodomonas_salina.3